MFSCNLRCLLIFLHGRSRTYRVASLRAGSVAVFRITCTLIVNMCGVSLVISINEYTLLFFFNVKLGSSHASTPYRALKMVRAFQRNVSGNCALEGYFMIN